MDNQLLLNFGYDLCNQLLEMRKHILEDYLKSIEKGYELLDDMYDDPD